MGSGSRPARRDRPGCPDPTAPDLGGWFQRYLQHVAGAESRSTQPARFHTHQIHDPLFAVEVGDEDREAHAERVDPPASGDQQWLIGPAAAHQAPSFVCSGVCYLHVPDPISSL